MNEAQDLINKTNFFEIETREVIEGISLGKPQAGHCLVELSHAFIVAGGFIDEVSISDR